MSTIPVGQDEPPENQEVEILYMRRQEVEDDSIYVFEMHFLSDHNLIMKATKNGDEVIKCMLWESLAKVREVAARTGWEVEWNPNWAPGLSEFSKSVRF